MSAQASANWRSGAATEGPEYDTDPELALAAVLQLLSRFPARRSPALAQAIASHFRVIGSDPRLSACLRDCAARLVRDWEAYAVLGEAGDLSQDSRVLH
ncbi:MAG TPA: hypothetical protein P5537_06820 [Thauera sp.]|uniref:hypothetical protein n=1 Tax=Thauera sp. TaxID=1905334 RepID=UPI000F9679F1|nr:hypothetical protein [Thauera sp.]RTL24750.1 MAG: hypothetical protein EKK55_10840 [Rhodocyclaceae bacterium]MCB1946859.1 hypothetical protein [Thauera sp.]MCP5225408.1 hypothetical protein [Thauera sp.]HPE03993.1 hypothetical protein [Thauera sp.]HRV77790.1 hypothetical protein [Thauera sp.]